MISRIDHVSIAVKDYEKALDFFQNILGAVPGTGMKDDEQKYFWQLFSLGDLSRIELMTPTGNGSFLDNFLAKKKTGGVHHITMQTPDIQAAMKRLDERNIPYFGFSDLGETWKEVFIHPKDAFGILIQIAQFDPDDWLGQVVKLPQGTKWIAEKSDNTCKLQFAHPGGGHVELELTKEEIKSLISDLSKVS